MTPYPVRFLLLVASLLFCERAAAQSVRIGVVGGFDTRRDFAERLFPATATDAGFATESKSTSYLIGPAIQIELTPRFSLEANALYKPLLFTDSTVLLDGSRRSQSPATVVTWQFPILAKYRISSGAIRPFVEGGPSFRASGNLNSTRPSKAGLTAGLGLQIPVGGFRVEPRVRYTRWSRDRAGVSTSTTPDQVEFLVGFYGDSQRDWKPLGSRLSLGVALGTNLTRYYRIPDSPLDNSLIVGPVVRLGLSSEWYVQFSALHNEIVRPAVANRTGQENATWEFPVVLRWRVPVRLNSTVSPVVEAGPVFRTPQQINGADLSQVGVAAGAGVEVKVSRFRLTPVVRYVHWGEDNRSGQSQVRRNQVQVLAEFTF